MDLSGQINMISRTPFSVSLTCARIPDNSYGHRPPVLFIVASVYDADPAMALPPDPIATAPYGPTVTGISLVPLHIERYRPPHTGPGLTSAPALSALPEPFPARNDPGLAVSLGLCLRIP